MVEWLYHVKPHDTNKKGKEFDYTVAATIFTFLSCSGDVPDVTRSSIWHQEN